MNELHIITLLSFSAIIAAVISIVFLCLNRRSTKRRFNYYQEMYKSGIRNTDYNRYIEITCKDDNGKRRVYDQETGTIEYWEDIKQ